MKYIVSGAVVLRFEDGTSFSLTPGIHDDFPANVKAHWAFGSYAEKLTDDNAAALTAGEEDLKAQLTALTETNAELSLQLAGLSTNLDEKNTQLAVLTETNTTLTQQLAARDTELEDLKAQLTALTETPTDAPASDAATDATASTDPSKDKGNGKK